MKINGKFLNSIATIIGAAGGLFALVSGVINGVAQRKLIEENVSEYFTERENKEASEEKVCDDEELDEETEPSEDDK